MLCYSTFTGWALFLAQATVHIPSVFNASLWPVARLKHNRRGERFSKNARDEFVLGLIRKLVNLLTSEKKNFLTCWHITKENTLNLLTVEKQNRWTLQPKNLLNSLTCEMEKPGMLVTYWQYRRLCYLCLFTVVSRRVRVNSTTICRPLNKAHTIRHSPTIKPYIPQITNL